MHLSGPMIGGAISQLRETTCVSMAGDIVSTYQARTWGLTSALTAISEAGRTTSTSLMSGLEFLVWGVITVLGLTISSRLLEWSGD